MKRFIVLTSARSGSNLLIELLNQHPKISCLGEILQPKAEHVDLMVKDPISFCITKMDYNEVPDGGWRGFKIFYVQAMPEYWKSMPSFIPSPSQRIIEKRSNAVKSFEHLDFDVINKRFEKFWDFLKDFHVIHLERCNLLEMYCSLRMAYLTDEWAVRKNFLYRIIPQFLLSEEPKPHLYLSYKDCRDCFEFIEDVRRKRLEHFSHSPLITVQYEALKQNPQNVMKKIYDFLDIEPQKCGPTSIQKQSTVPISETIENYKELKESFHGSRWEDFFE